MESRKKRTTGRKQSKMVPLGPILCWPLPVLHPQHPQLRVQLMLLSRSVLSEEEELHSEMNMMPITCLCNHRQNFDPSSEDNFISSISYPKIFGYLIPILVAVIGVNVQGTSKPLMETHRVSLCVSLVAIIAHCVAFAADNMSRRHQANSSQLWGLIAVIFGSLSAASLVSTFFTQSIAEIICYIALSSAAIFMVLYQFGRGLMDACHWLYHRILRPFFCKISNWFQGHYNNFSLPEQQQRPAV